MASATYLLAGLIFILAGAILAPVLSTLVPANIALNFLIPLFPFILGVIMMIAGIKRSD